MKPKLKPGQYQFSVVRDEFNALVESFEVDFGNMEIFFDYYGDKENKAQLESVRELFFDLVRDVESEFNTDLFSPEQ